MDKKKTQKIVREAYGKIARKEIEENKGQNIAHPFMKIEKKVWPEFFKRYWMETRNFFLIIRI